MNNNNYSNNKTIYLAPSKQSLSVYELNINTNETTFFYQSCDFLKVGY